VLEKLSFTARSHDNHQGAYFSATAGRSNGSGISSPIRVRCSPMAVSPDREEACRALAIPARFRLLARADDKSLSERLPAGDGEVRAALTVEEDNHHEAS
jgi:hypothetical protein